MNKSYIEWLDYYEYATKEDVIQDMMLDINNIKEKDKEILRLRIIINRTIEYIENNSLYTENYDYDYDENPYLISVDDINQREDLLNILKGDDND